MFPVGELYAFLELMVKPSEIIESTGYCGLVCCLCHLARDCGGCRSTDNRCPRHCSDTGCYQYKCCRERNLNGCWECPDFSCNKDMFSKPHDLRLRAFVRFIRDEGLEKFAECIVENEKRGIRYGHQQDYDGLQSEEEVLTLLRTGIIGGQK